jgi:hypothetical protein
LPGVHRAVSLLKRWLLGTHEVAVGVAHLPSYLDKFAFRFNARTSRSRGMVVYRLLHQAVAHAPVHYLDLVGQPTPSRTMPVPPTARGRPPSLQRPYQDRPWRHTPENQSD